MAKVKTIKLYKGELDVIVNAHDAKTWVDQGWSKTKKEEEKSSPKKLGRPSKAEHYSFGKEQEEIE